MRGRQSKRRAKRAAERRERAEGLIGRLEAAPSMDLTGVKLPGQRCFLCELDEGRRFRLLESDWIGTVLRRGLLSVSIFAPDYSPTGEKDLYIAPATEVIAL